MRQKRRLEWTVAALGMALGMGCGGGGISRQEAAERAEEIQADLLAGAGGEAVRELRELAARPPDRPLRDSATALVGEIEDLFDEVIAVRTELLERAEPAAENERTGVIARLFTQNPVRMAEAALERAEARREGSWPEIRADLEGETIEAVDKGMRGGGREHIELKRWLETDRQTLARVREESEARRAAEEEQANSTPVEAPAAPAERELVRESEASVEQATVGEEAVQEAEGAVPTPRVEPEEAPVDEPPAPPDPEAVRDSAEAEVEALGPLHDELIEVLEAIHEALSDPEEKRQAEGRVTMARFAKGREVEGLEADVAAEPEWRLRNARRGAARAKTRLERDIEEARATLARIRGG